MTFQLDDLYQEIIMDHRKRPRNMFKPDGANRSSEGYNPFCGDRVLIHLAISDGLITAAGFEGEGCAISTASASMLAETIEGKTTIEAVKMFESFRAMLTGDDSHCDLDDLGDLVALAGVREFPVRIKCAVLSWHTMKAALEQSEDSVTTE